MLRLLCRLQEERLTSITGKPRILLSTPHHVSFQKYYKIINVVFIKIIIISLMAAKRPLPQLIEIGTPPAPLSEGSESDAGGRRHMSSSVPRTVFSTEPEKAAMKKLKQKMTFSDHSVSYEML